jgi:Spy/CpxP family protein refolding chaperone
MRTKYLVAMFLVSLLLNAFVGGKMLSGYIEHGAMQMGMKKDGGPHMESIIFKRVNEQSEKLSPDGQKKVAVIVEKFQKLNEKSGVEDKHELFDEIQTTMTAPTFDREKIEKIHKELNVSETKFKETIGKMMIEIASELSNEDRIKFFQGLFPPHDHD